MSELDDLSKTEDLLKRIFKNENRCNLLEAEVTKAKEDIVEIKKQQSKHEEDVTLALNALTTAINNINGTFKLWKAVGILSLLFIALQLLGPVQLLKILLPALTLGA